MSGTLALLLLTWLTDADAGVAPPRQLSVRTTPSSAKLGEPFTVEVVVTHDQAQRYELITPGDLGDFEAFETQRSRVDGADSSTTTFHLKLAAYTLGKQKTPTLTLEVSAPNGVAQLPSPGADVDIVSTLPADAQTKGEDLYDVKAPEEVPVRTWRLLYALGALLAAGLLGYALYRYLTRPRPVRLEPEKPREPLHLRTTGALDALAKENLPAQGRVKEFYFRLSEIMRAYLGELYSFDALESTTPELLEALRSRNTPGLPMSELADFAWESDFVRYARASVEPARCKVALELGYRVVHATAVAIPVPRPSTPPTRNGPEPIQ